MKDAAEERRYAELEKEDFGETLAQFEASERKSVRGKFTWSEAEGRLIPYVEPQRARTHHVVTDEIPGGVMSHADCQMYTSKRKLRDAYRRLGKVEVGNEAEWAPKRDERAEREKREADVRADLERAYYDLRDNNAREMDADTRERCKRIDHNLREYNYDRRDRDRDGNVRR